IDRSNHQWMAIEIGPISSEIGKMDWLSALSNTVYQGAAPGHHTASPLTCVSLCQYTVERRVAEAIYLVEPQRTITRLTKPHRVGQHGFKHWLQFAGRRAYDAQHLRCRSLLFQGLGEIGRALAQFVQQPRVLDCDDGLSGEVLNKRDLLVGKGTNLLAVDSNSAD